MRPRALIISAVFICLCLAGVFYFKARQPRYHGKSLDHWLSQLQAGPTQRSNATVALRAMGPKAVPHLVRMIEHRPLRERAHALWRQVRPGTTFGMGFGPDDPRRLAAIALGLLGNDARPALPRLERIVQNQSFPFVSTAEAAIIRIRGDPIDKLVATLWAPQNSSWHRSLFLVAELGPEVGERAIPPIIAACETTNLPARPLAFLALGSVAGASEAALKTLVAGTTDQDSAVRQFALGGLNTMQSDAAELAIINCLHHADPATRVQAVSILNYNRVLLDTNRAISNLTLRLNDSSEFVRESAKQLLKKLRKPK